MRTKIFVILAACVFISQPMIASAEDAAPLLKGGVSMDVGTDSELANEDSRHDGKMTALDTKERGLDAAHKEELKAIEEQEDLEGKSKSYYIEEENKQYEKKKKDIERERAIEEKVHTKRAAEIMKKLADSVEEWEDKSIPRRMMKLAAEMDRVTTEIQDNAMEAGNKFFKGVAKSVSRTGKFLAQKPGTVMPQMMEGVVEYLNNDFRENDQKLYEAAAQAVEEMENDPATFFGEHAVDIALSASGAAAEIAEARAVGAASELGAAGKMGQAGKELGQAGGAEKQASQRAAQQPPPPRRPAPAGGTSSNEAEKRAAVEQARREQASRQPPPRRPSSGTPSSDAVKRESARRARDQAQRQKQQAKDLERAARTVREMADDARKFSSFDLVGSVKPEFFKAVTQAKKWKTGKFVSRDAATGNASIPRILKQEFGSGKAQDPFHSGVRGLKGHQEGLPIASSQKKIERALLTAGNNSQGLVFVDGGKGKPGRIFNVRNKDGKIEFWDFQANPPVQFQHLKGKRIFFYRLY